MLSDSIPLGNSDAPAIFYLVLGIVLMGIVLTIGKLLLRKKK